MTSTNEAYNPRHELDPVVQAFIDEGHEVASEHYDLLTIQAITARKNGVSSQLAEAVAFAAVSIEYDDLCSSKALAIQVAQTLQTRYAQA